MSSFIPQAVNFQASINCNSIAFQCSPHNEDLYLTKYSFTDFYRNWYGSSWPVARCLSPFLCTAQGRRLGLDRKTRVAHGHSWPDVFNYWSCERGKQENVRSFITHQLLNQDEDGTSATSAAAAAVSMPRASCRTFMSSDAGYECRTRACLSQDVRILVRSIDDRFHVMAWIYIWYKCKNSAIDLEVLIRRC